MDPGLAVAVLLFVVALAGGGFAVTRNRALPWSRPLSLVRGDSAAAPTRNEAPEGSPSSPRPIAARPVLAPVKSPVQPPRDDVPVVAQDDGDQAPPLPLAARLERIETRLDELMRAVERQRAELQLDVRQASAASANRLQADEARWEAALERMRADLLTTLTSSPRDRQLNTAVRRAEVSADLYARLARLEAALSAVTNPVLLPGESYEPPEEFLPESLVWENWGEVGERAFALADAFNAQRLYLSDACCGEFETFVTSLRTRLTRSVYPNLQPEPSLAQQTALRAALIDLAADLPKARSMLEREYREAT